MSYPYTQPEHESPWLPLAGSAASIAAPAIGGLFGPVGGAIGGLIGGAAYGWSMKKAGGESGNGSILLGAALGAISGGLGAKFGRTLLADKKINAAQEAREIESLLGLKHGSRTPRAIPTFDSRAMRMFPTAMSYTLAEVSGTLGRMALSDKGLLPTALPTKSIGRGN